MTYSLKIYFWSIKKMKKKIKTKKIVSYNLKLYYKKFKVSLSDELKILMIYNTIMYYSN